MSVHVLPINDLFEHEEFDCPCGPYEEPSPLPDGSLGWVTVHHSLDGREKSEGRSA